MAKTETCEGLVGPGSMRRGESFFAHSVHCPGCTSATERIAELEKKLRSKVLCAERRRNILNRVQMDRVSMRTLVGELAVALKACEAIEDHVLACKSGCEICHEYPELSRVARDSRLFALAKAQKLGVGDAPTL